MPWITFSRPWFLLLLVALAPMAFWAGRSLAALPPNRTRWARGLRLAIVTLLTLAIAGIRLVLPSDRLCVIFLVDVSKSMPASSQAWAMHYLTGNLAAMGPRDEAAVIVFGGDAYLQLPPAPKARIAQFAALTSTDATDIAKAIRLALATFPEGAQQRIVLLSDGNENLGDARQEVAVAAARGVQVNTVIPPAVDQSEAWVSAVDAPAQRSQGEPYELRVVVKSTRAGPATLTIYRSGRLIGRQAVTLDAGDNVFLVPQPADRPGAYDYEAVIEAPFDTVAANNHAFGLTVVKGKPRVLYLTSEPPGRVALPGILAAAGLQVDVRGPRGLPTSLTGLQHYSALVLSNVSALNFSEAQLEMIKVFVQDLGGGLVMIGGPDSFGVGGYYQTPVEDALPVSMDIRKRRLLPSLAIVFCIDKSGSMGEFTKNATVDKMALARQAAIVSMDFLGPKDQIAVYAFDEAYKEVVPLRFADDKKTIVDLIGSLRAGGGTWVYPALEAAYHVLRSSPAALKHVIVLSDGMTAPGDYDGLVKKMVAGKITVSTVAVGQDADLHFMQHLAAAGRGRFYHTDDASLLPRLFTKDTIIASRSTIIEEAFVPKRGDPLPALRGVDLSRLPPLIGYVGTSAKARAQVVLATHLDDPLLAAWRTGLGKAVAFTSDEGARWARRWLSWPGLRPFWSQLVRWTLPEVPATQFQARVEIQGNEGRIVVDAVNPQGEYLNFLNLTATVIGPDLKPIQVPLAQAGPGRYEGRFDAKGTGLFWVNLAQSEKGRVVGVQSVTADLPYSPEYRNLTPNRALLETLAKETAGTVYAPPSGAESTWSILPPSGAESSGNILDADQPFAHTLPPARIPRELWEWAATLALALWPFDIAVRRLFLPAGWGTVVAERLSRLRRRPAALRESGATLASLKSVKATAQTRRPIADKQPFKPLSTQAAAPGDPLPIGGKSPGEEAETQEIQASVPLAQPMNKPPPEEGGSSLERLKQAKARIRRPPG